MFSSKTLYYYFARTYHYLFTTSSRAAMITSDGYFALEKQLEPSLCCFVPTLEQVSKQYQYKDHAQKSNTAAGCQITSSPFPNTTERPTINKTPNFKLTADSTIDMDSDYDILDQQIDSCPMIEHCHGDDIKVDNIDFVIVPPEKPSRTTEEGFIIIRKEASQSAYTHHNKKEAKTNNYYENTIFLLSCIEKKSSLLFSYVKFPFY